MASERCHHGVRVPDGEPTLEGRPASTQGAAVEVGRLPPPKVKFSRSSDGEHWYAVGPGRESEEEAERDMKLLECEADPTAELDELLAEALPCPPALKGSIMDKACASGDHWQDCPGRYIPALRRHLAAWVAAKGAEAELRRRLIDKLVRAVAHTLDCDLAGCVNCEGAMEAAKEAVSALARPRPSASGLLELLEELRRAKLVCPDCNGEGEDATTCGMCNGEGVLPDRGMRGVADHLAAELGLEVTSAP